MRYIVRVKHSSGDVDPKVDEFEDDSRDADDLSALHDRAVDAYTSAVQSYDHGHTVSLFRALSESEGLQPGGMVTVHEALGTGAGSLLDETSDSSDQV